MPIMFSYDGKDFDIDDVPLSVYADIEKATEVPWYRLSAGPMRYAAAGEMLAKECAKLVGVDLPALTPKLLVKLFEVREDVENRPTEYADGIPDPKAQGSVPATT